mmetsp:Transcript_12035/g.14605  ORF Transcript_12035/g.14605 Transcript_12035/m.14605 type:complete len:212 (-) Transcript_12035:552-1187(-)
MKNFGPTELKDQHQHLEQQTRQHQLKNQQLLRLQRHQRHQLRNQDHHHHHPNLLHQALLSPLQGQDRLYLHQRSHHHHQSHLHPSPRLLSLRQDRLPVPLQQPCQYLSRGHHGQDLWKLLGEANCYHMFFAMELEAASKLHRLSVKEVVLQLQPMLLTVSRHLLLSHERLLLDKLMQVDQLLPKSLHVRPHYPDREHCETETWDPYAFPQS